MFFFGKSIPVTIVCMEIAFMKKQSVHLIQLRLIMPNSIYYNTEMYVRSARVRSSSPVARAHSAS